MRVRFLTWPAQAFLLIFLLSLSASADRAQSGPPQSFETFLASRFTKIDAAWKIENFCPVATDPVSARVLREYGGVFAATESVVVPNTCLFKSESDTLKFQDSLTISSLQISDVRIALQKTAAAALQKSIAEAAIAGFSITPYDGAIAGSRSYGDTLRLWNGRFFSALDHWVRRGRLSAVDRDAAYGVDLPKRIEMIMNWESQGIYFSTDRSRSIFSSTAPPGASQHLMMIAFDVAEYSKPEVRAILTRNGWYQTVIGDPLHFTFLGVPETELPGRGLRLVVRGPHRYWVPNITMPTR